MRRQHWVGSLLRPSLVVLLVMTVVTGAVVYQARSGPEYVDQSFEHALTIHFLIEYHYIYAVPTDGALGLLECTRACVRTTGCASFLMLAAEGRCALTKYNRCAGPTQPLVSMAGAKFYDLLPATEMSELGGRTCLGNCRVNHGCSRCGRNNCAGELCDLCSVFCWQLDPQITGLTSVYISPSERRQIECSGEWQLGWRRSFNYYSQLSAVSLTLKVTILYTNTTLSSTTALFDSVQYTSGLLTVGTFLSGDAGNGWGAPFTNRPTSTPDGSVESFFYPSGVTRAGGVLSYQEQLDLNYTTIIRGYYWPSSDPARSEARIQTISLWLTQQ
ncbi:hypothetical protein Pmani_015506 [Petrolisthes manimaculis]|uniref:Apple domain-containing protein n=1 Tax=Petrolisthes manimaculis TaxID=1843537 RepID=A0AAE1PTF3_9EUCA|nr:hypothetical protein Pmani_015506 [Petrolisthes manimaculis]